MTEQEIKQIGMAYKEALPKLRELQRKLNEACSEIKELTRQTITKLENISKS